MGYTVRRPFPRLHLFLHRLPARPTPSRRHPRPPRPSWAGATDSTSAPTRFHLPTPTLTGGIHTNALPSALKALRYRTLPYERPTPPSADRRVRATAALLPWSGAAAAHRPLYVGRTVDEATSQLAQAAAHPGPACLHAPAQRRTDPALNQVPLAPAEAPASNPESIRQASRHARAGRIQACGLHAVLDATAREEVITTSAQDAEKRPMASCDLIDTLPAYRLAHACGVTETRLQYLEATGLSARPGAAANRPGAQRRAAGPGRGPGVKPGEHQAGVSPRTGGAHPGMRPTRRPRRYGPRGGHHHLGAGRGKATHGQRRPHRHAAGILPRARVRRHGNAPAVSRDEPRRGPLPAGAQEEEIVPRTGRRQRSDARRPSRPRGGGPESCPVWRDRR